MSYELIVLDIDGTLTNSKKEITPNTLNSLINIQKAGKRVILASGRPPQGIKAFAKELQLEKYNGYILSYNGGLILDCKDNSVFFQKVMNHERVREIYAEIKGAPLSMVTYEKDCALIGNTINDFAHFEARLNNLSEKYLENFSDYVDFDVNKCLLTGDSELILNLEHELNNKYKGELSIYRSEPFFLEIMPANINKAESLDKLVKFLGLSKEQCICCGDGFNDLSMIEYAGLGVAMSNGNEKVKAAADYITLSNDNDGIVHVIEQFMTN